MSGVDPYATPEQLTKVAIDEEDLPLEAGLVRVRGLSRGEVFAMQKSKADGGLRDEDAWERRLVSIALLRPKLTEEQVAEWQQGPAGGDLETLTKKISDLSKLSEGADKSRVSGTGQEPGA